MKEVKLFSAILCVLTISSCNKETVTNPNQLYGANVDSLELSTNDNNIISIDVGDYIGNKPLSSQVVFESDGEKYYMLDDSKIYIFNWDTGKLCDSVLLKEQGNIGNYSGFSVVSKDSILLYNYAKKTIQYIDSHGDIFGTINLRNNGVAHPDIEGLNGTRMQKINHQVICTGAILGDIRENRVKDTSSSIALNFSNQNIQTLMTYPEIYRKGNWGGVYMNMVYHTSAKGKYMFYSFPIDHNIYKVDMDTGETTSFYMGSKYCDAIESSQSNFMEEFMDKNKRISYYLHEHSYAMVLFDVYRNQIVRIAEHPTEKIEDDGTFSKPFSVIISDLEGKKLSESRVIDNAENFDLYNMHITKQGLSIAYIQKDENKIVFKTYKLN